MTLIAAADANVANSGTPLINTTSSQIAAANLSRNGISFSFDPATASSVVYLLLGTGTASAANFHIALNNTFNTWNGTVGATVWRGPVQAYTPTAAGIRVGVVEV